MARGFYALVQEKVLGEEAEKTAANLSTTHMGFRTLYNGICYRLLAFWDTQNNSLVLATHGFVQKTDKTPKKEIERAENIRAQYFNNKNKN